MREYVLCAAVRGDRVLVFDKVAGPRGARGLNGPGGGVEVGESPQQAASREWSEEVVGLPDIPEAQWRKVGEMGSETEGWLVHVMAARVPAPAFPLLVDDSPATFVDPQKPLPRSRRSGRFAPLYWAEGTADALSAAVKALRQ